MELRDATQWNLRRPVASPLVWRELVEFGGGRRLLIGGAGEFQDYVHTYYGLTSRMSSCRMIRLAKENVSLKEQVCRSAGYCRHGRMCRRATELI